MEVTRGVECRMTKENVDTVKLDLEILGVDEKMYQRRWRKIIANPSLTKFGQ